MWGWLRNLASELALVREVSGLERSARRLYEAGRFDDAIVALRAALNALAVPRSATFYGVQTTLRLSVVMLLAAASAKIGDRPLATTSISDGLALLDMIRRGNPAFRFDDGVRAWEDWARKYAG